MAEVWLIRHGESISNANQRTKHPVASPLTDRGKAEAALVPDAFNGRKPALVVTSSYVRAQQTAVPTLSHFAPIPQEIWPVHEFTYLAPQRYDGTKMEDRRPWATAYWQRRDPFFKDDDVGESFAECMARIQTLIERLQTHEAPFIAIFSHGLFIRLLLLRLLTGETAVSPETMSRSHHLIRAIKFPNCGICVAQFGQAGDLSFSNIRTDHLND